MGDEAATLQRGTGARSRATGYQPNAGLMPTSVHAGNTVPNLPVANSTGKNTVVYKFRVNIDAEMRATEGGERKKRHRLVWMAILRASATEIRDDFNAAYANTQPDSALGGLNSAYKKTDPFVLYSLKKILYNRLDYPLKMLPDAESKLNQTESQAVIIVSEFRKLRKKFTPEQNEIVDRKLQYIVDRVSNDDLADTPVNQKLLLLLGRAIDETAELGDFGLVYLNGNALSYRKEFSNKQVYSPELAVAYLDRYLSVLNLLKIDKARRKRNLSSAITAYNQAQEAIKKYLPAVNFLILVEQANTEIIREKARGEHDKLKIGEKSKATIARDLAQSQYHEYLKKNGSSHKVFTQLRKDYGAAFGQLFRLMLQQALMAYIRLLSFEVRKHRDSGDYFTQLYLKWVRIPKNGSRSELETRYPIIQFFNQKGFEKHNVYRLAKKVRANKRYQLSGVPEEHFAAILQRKAHKHLEDLVSVNKEIGGTSPEIWRLDKALVSTHKSLGIHGSNFQWVIGKYASRRSRKSIKRIVLDVLLLVVSVIPMGRIVKGLVSLGLNTKAATAIGVLVKGGVAGIDAVEAKGLVDDIEKAKLFERTNLSSSSPSYIWAVAMIAASGYDIADLAAFAKVSTKTVVKDLHLTQSDELVTVLRFKYNVKNEALARSVAKHRDNFDKFKDALKTFFKEVPNRPASIVALGDETTKMIYYGLKAGVSGVETYIKLITKARAGRKLSTAEKNTVQDIYAKQYFKVTKTHLKIPKHLRDKLDVETVAWLHQHGLWTKGSIRSIGASGTSKEIIESLNKFRGAKGFESVVADWISGGNKQAGARFVMRYSLRNFKVHPSKIRFEVRVPRNPTFKANGQTGGNALRVIDVMVDGTKYEFKNIKRVHKRYVYSPRTKEQKAQEALKQKERVAKRKKREAEQKKNQDQKESEGKHDSKKDEPVDPSVYVKGELRDIHKVGQLYKDMRELILAMGPIPANPKLKWIINGQKGLTKEDVVKKFFAWLNETDLVDLPGWKNHGKALLTNVIEVTK